ncbi:uroporphyrinogen decarboxylase family protein [Thermatribacter velox]|jgi:uroporphyrinogen decarboxylase|uniref:Uroporphyrinogen decarboxylase family protein n=1 Tax=Thermatribacter velox TaxID=3039681 RepID=A0ABZ2YBL8_9BACT|nr:uroporphyrinogen decarboxylase [Candidatus Atribacteria bacterium]
MNSRKKDRFNLTNLAQYLYEEGRRPVVPLMGYPGLQLTGTTVKQNQFNHIVQFRSLSRLYDRFRPDAMFFLMDLSVEASALGLPVRFPLEETPSVEEHPVKSLEDLEKFENIDILGDGRVMVYLETLRHMKVALPCPVGAFVIGPLTLAGLLTGANEIAIKSLTEPDFFEGILQFSQRIILRYAQALSEAGADTLMVLEPTAVIFGPQQFRNHLAPLYRELVGVLDDLEITLHVCGDTTHLLKEMAQCGVSGLSLDSMVDFGKAAEIVGKDILLIGNISPIEMLQEKPQKIYSDTLQLLNTMREHPLFVLSTGCDLPQDVPFENIEAFFKAGREWTLSALKGIKDLAIHSQ